MAGEYQQRLQTEIDSMVKSLEKEQMRKMQRKMYLCSAECCNDASASMMDIHSCVGRCNAPFVQMQDLLTSELSRFQDRLNRCAMNCNDMAKDSLDSGSKEPEARAKLQSCVIKCAEEHMSLIPSMTKKLKDAFIEADKKTS